MTQRSLDGYLCMEEYSRGAAAWPEIALSEATFLLHVARLRGDAAGPGLLHAEDLFLACACAHQVVGAVPAFEARFGPEIDAALRRFSHARATVDELRQRLREHLFAHPTEPKIAKYTGAAPLVYWVRLVALRIARDFYRRGASLREVTGENEALFAAAESDLEVSAMKSELVPIFKAAFADAFASLGARDKTLLRLYIVESMSIDEVARILRVHRATAARRIAAARSKLTVLARAELGQRARLSPAECESAFRLIESQLDASVSRVFAEASAVDVL
jgi:RNA polymerase sigma-70 factor (ECF subfamily)